MRDTIAAVETFPQVKMRTPEVEITRRFDDPGHRLRAMNDFADMVQWFAKAGRSGKLLMCRVEDGMIIWKFECRDKATAKAFDATFDQETTDHGG